MKVYAIASLLAITAAGGAGMGSWASAPDPEILTKVIKVDVCKDLPVKNITRTTRTRDGTKQLGVEFFIESRCHHSCYHAGDLPCGEVCTVWGEWKDDCKGRTDDGRCIPRKVR